MDVSQRKWYSTWVLVAEYKFAKFGEGILLAKAQNHERGWWVW